MALYEMLGGDEWHPRGEESLLATSDQSQEDTKAKKNGLTRPKSPVLMLTSQNKSPVSLDPISVNLL